MLDADVAAAIGAVVADWKARHEAGGDCTECMLELTQILLPFINRGEVSRDEAMQLTIAAGNWANGSDPTTFPELLDTVANRL